MEQYFLRQVPGFLCIGAKVKPQNLASFQPELFHRDPKVIPEVLGFYFV